MKKIFKYLISVFFVLGALKAQAYAAEPGQPDAPLEAIARPGVEYKAQGLRNPFARALSGANQEKGKEAQEVKSLPPLTVQGLIWGSDMPQAIINNKVVKIGDNLEGADIITIDKEGVTVLFAGVEHQLTTLPLQGQQGE